MLRKLINRPIAVSMIVVAVMVIGIVALTHIPVSMMPQIDIPRITVQMSSPGASVTEIEQKLVGPMRQQLAQVAGLKDIESVSRSRLESPYTPFAENNPVVPFGHNVFGTHQKFLKSVRESAL